MCGIAGRFSCTALPPDPGWRPRADALLAHRGPDGSGDYVDGRCEFVHRRLALLDLSHNGLQPMGNEDGQIQLVFNGEIYNWRELRSELQSLGHVFTSTTDSEVLVHLYEERGEELVDRLRGMFAFALYDRNARRLLLARDRFGIKPLYYAELDDQVVFASEIKAILAVRGLTPTLDRQACYDYLGLSYMPEPGTGFSEIRLLPKGSTLLVDARGARERSYARLEPRPEPGLGIEGATEGVADAVLRAVRAQSVADVPVAALLSGGIDSSLLVAAYCKTATRPPVTFNVRFPDARYDETPYALAVAERYGTEHRTVEFQDAAVSPDLLETLLLHFDQPFADTSLIPTYQVSQAIRDQGVVCAISGDGGDESFGGYLSFPHMESVFRLMRLPIWLNRTMAAGGGLLAPYTRDMARRVGRAAGLAAAGRRSTETVLAGLMSYMSESQKRELVLLDARTGLASIERILDAGEKPARGLEDLSRRLTRSMFDVSLPGDMLRKVDMMSMRASIEVRVPMLDEDVVACGLALPHRLKSNGSTGKLVLRSLAQQWLPDEVAAHRKQGFGIPLDRMATPKLHDMLRDVLLDPAARVRGVLDLGLVGLWLDRFRASGQGKASGEISREGLYQRVIIVLALELWLRRHRLSW